MIGFNKEVLAHMGIAFETDEETQVFVEIIEEELEVRVGKNIGKDMKRQQVLEFPKLEDPDAMAQWLEKFCPDFRNITRRTFEQMKQEIMEYRSEIPGAVINENIEKLKESAV